MPTMNSIGLPTISRRQRCGELKHSLCSGGPSLRNRWSLNFSIFSVCFSRTDFSESALDRTHLVQLILSGHSLEQSKKLDEHWKILTDDPQHCFVRMPISISSGSFLPNFQSFLIEDNRNFLKERKISPSEVAESAWIDQLMQKLTWSGYQSFWRETRSLEEASIIWTSCTEKLSGSECYDSTATQWIVSNCIQSRRVPAIIIAITKRTIDDGESVPESKKVFAY